MGKKLKKIVSLLLVLALTLSLADASVLAKEKPPAGLGAHHGYAVIDARTGKVLMGDKETKKLYPASTTKLMTATVLLENSKLSKKVKITKAMLKKCPAGMSIYRLKAGQTYTMETLLNMILIPSAGDAAYCAGIAVFGSVKECVAAMNRKVKALGLKGTHFDNPAGLDIGNGFKKIILQPTIWQ